MKKYNETDIQVLEGLEAIRLMPGMYVGGTDKQALHHLIWEIVANSLDEHLAGYGCQIQVTLDRKGGITVKDEGRGIPLGLHPKTGLSTLETILTIPHAGGKFGSGGYSISGGLHGVGSTCVNALSAKFIATVYRDGKKVTHVYERGKKIQEKEISYDGKSGTTITFYPDPMIFETTEFSPELIRTRLRQFAFLNPALTITFTHEEDTKETDTKKEVFHFPNGLKDYIAYLHKGKEKLHNAWFIQAQKDGVELEAVLQYADHYATNFLSFANLIPTKEGGTHETGVKAGLTKTMNEFAKEKGWLKESLTGDEWMEGLTCIMSVKLAKPKFEGQTKNKLSNTEVRAIVQAIVSDHLLSYLQKDQAQVKKIAEKAILARRAKEAAKKARELTRNGGKKQNYAHLVSGKFAACSGRDAKKNELFIVEGDSAGGSAKQGRDRIFQSILSLKGKPLNVEKSRIDKILANEEIRSIITAVGGGIGQDFDVKKVKHQKVIIMTDADVDGAHIRTILLTFFFRYMKPLIEAGYLYIAQPPLYKIESSRKVQYAYSEREKNQLVKGLKNVTIQRYKGLGEMNPTQLWETTMNPDNRLLYQVTMEDVLTCDEWLSLLMGDKIEPRKEFITKGL
ncbi:DNA gyrase subunit B [Neobacillus sp. YIM B02564]|uniref:DNA topoisomerase (ATP-hydrolyzing) n=1 Tax=Neobacillus paridis TaxID=2803862 RepID=A0ABS1TLB2_9BACI|nr:DNA gyrase subunit B [Neobacillus paridis]MBL4952087.1 DNA gyrase subunit B [Neobacillus paridis]